MLDSMEQATGRFDASADGGDGHATDRLAARRAALILAVGQLAPAMGARPRLPLPSEQPRVPRPERAIRLAR
jgi:hypothetical protein